MRSPARSAGDGEALEVQLVGDQRDVVDVGGDRTPSPAG
jgi:hypothetical protein